MLRMPGCIRSFSAVVSCAIAVQHFASSFSALFTVATTKQSFDHARGIAASLQMLKRSACSRTAHRALRADRVGPLHAERPAVSVPRGFVSCSPKSDHLVYRCVMRLCNFSVVSYVLLLFCFCI